MYPVYSSSRRFWERGGRTLGAACEKREKGVRNLQRGSFSHWKKGGRTKKGGWNLDEREARVGAQPRGMWVDSRFWIRRVDDSRSSWRGWTSLCLLRGAIIIHHRARGAISHRAISQEWWNHQCWCNPRCVDGPGDALASTHASTGCLLCAVSVELTWRWISRAVSRMQVRDV
jgi:hypothetical protein